MKETASHVPKTDNPVKRSASNVHLSVMHALSMHVSHSSLWRAQAKRGGLANTDAIDLLAAVMKGVIAQTHIDPKVTRGHQG